MNNNVDEIQKIRLYTDFLHYIHDHKGWQYFNSIFLNIININAIQRIEQAKELIIFVEKNQMPEKIKQLFNEWLLTYKL